MVIDKFAVAAVDVVFSEDIDLSTFDHQDVSLSRSGGPNLITAGITIARVADATYRISGLESLTGEDGNYDLTVAGAGIAESSRRN